MPDTLSNAVLSDPPEYLGYYGLRDVPFRADTGMRAPWLGRAHREVLAALTAAIRDGDGVFVLTGDVGTGKTTLLNRLTEDLRVAAVIVGRLPPSVFELPELFQAVADAVGLDGSFPTAAAFAARFREFLGDAHAQGKRVVLVIDEAQGLGDELLPKLFALSTIGTFEEHPCAIILAGQSELGAALEKDQHAGLRQRIAGRYALDPLTPAEVGEYIRARLQAAGAGEVIFDPDAVGRIASISRGAPGLINVVCERALATGHRQRARVIGADIVDTSLGDVGWASAESAPKTEPLAGFVESGQEPVRPHRAAWSRGILAIGLLAILGTVGYGLYAGRFARPRTEPGRPPAAAVETKPSATPGPPGTRPSEPVGATATVERRPTEATAAAGGSEGEAAPAASEQREPATAAAPPGGARPEPQAPSAPARVERGERRARAAPADVEPRTRRQEVGRRDRVKPGTADIEATRPRGAPSAEPSSRERTVTRPAEKDADDPGAIIDWLIKESGR